MHFDEFVDKGETDSASFVTAAARSFDSVEALKKMRQLSVPEFRCLYRAQ